MSEPAPIVDDAIHAARARAVVARLGMRDVTSQVLEGGHENVVIRVVGDGRDVVVRFPRDTGELGADGPGGDGRGVDELGADGPGAGAFDVEAWAVRAAAGVGVPTSSIVDRGWADGMAYIVFDHLPGATADPDDLGVWRAVGSWIRALGGVDVSTAPGVMFSRFGRDLDLAWAAHIRYNIAESARDDDPLLALDVYRRSDLPALRAALVSLASRRLAHGLVHGDLSTRNVLGSGHRAVVDSAVVDSAVADSAVVDSAVVDSARVDSVASDGVVIDSAPTGYAVIDWGAAGTGPVPWADLGRLHRWNRMRDPLSPVSDAALAAAIDEALAGSGISAADAMMILEELALLSSLDLVRWAIDRRPDRLDEVCRESRALIGLLLRPSDSYRWHRPPSF